VATPGALAYVTVEAGDDVDTIADRVGCLIQTGARGCGFEQPLEAALKALTPAASELRFRQERGGVIESDTGGRARSIPPPWWDGAPTRECSAPPIPARSIPWSAMWMAYKRFGRDLKTSWRSWWLAAWTRRC